MKILALDPVIKSCPCGSWLKHWENFSGQSAIFCSVVECLNKDVLGVHVVPAGITDEKVYIIPLCRLHSRSLRELCVPDARRLVPVDQACGGAPGV